MMRCWGDDDGDDEKEYNVNGDDEDDDDDKGIDEDDDETREGSSGDHGDGEDDDGEDDDGDGDDGDDDETVEGSSGDHGAANTHLSRLSAPAHSHQKGMNILWICHFVKKHLLIFVMGICYQDLEEDHKN